MSQKKQQINFNLKQKDNKSSPEFKGKLELVLKLMNIIINLCIAESKKIKEKPEIIKLYNNIFKKEENDIFLSFQKYVLVDLINNIKETKPDISFAYLIFDPFNKFIQEKMSIDSLLDVLISILESLVVLVKKNGSKQMSTEIIDEFYNYLNGHAEKIIKAKKVTLPKKFNEEEENIKSLHLKSYQKTIIDLQEKLKKAEKDLEIESKKAINLSLDISSYKKSNNILSDKIKLVEKEKNSTISKQDETIKMLKNENKKNSLEYKNTIERIEQRIEERISQNNEENRKNIINLEKKINELEKSNKDIKKNFEQLQHINNQYVKEKEDNKNKINELEKSNKDLKKNFEQLQHINNQYVKEKEDNKNKINELEKSIEDNKYEIKKLNEQYINGKEIDKNKMEKLLKIITQNQNIIDNNKKNIELLQKEKDEILNMHRNDYYSLYNFCMNLIDYINQVYYDIYGNDNSNINTYGNGYEIGADDQDFFNINFFK